MKSLKDAKLTAEKALKGRGEKRTEGKNRKQLVMIDFNPVI